MGSTPYAGLMKTFYRALGVAGFSVYFFVFCWFPASAAYPNADYSVQGNYFDLSSVPNTTYESFTAPTNFDAGPTGSARQIGWVYLQSPSYSFATYNATVWVNGSNVSTITLGDDSGETTPGWKAIRISSAATFSWTAGDSIELKISTGPAFDFYIYGSADGSNCVLSDVCGPIGSQAISFDFSPTPPVPGPGDTSTRIITTTPANAGIIGSSSPMTIGATGYINPADYDEDEFLRFIVNVRIPNTFLWSSPSIVDVPIPASGDFDLTSSTTFPGISSLPEGQGTMKVEIINPNIFSSAVNWLSQWSAFRSQIGNLTYNQLAATSTTFIVGEPSFIDIANASSTQSMADFFAGIDLDSLLYDCYPSHLSLGSCVYDLIVPPDCAINSDGPTCDVSHAPGLIQQARNGVLTDAPIGYFTRFVDIVSTTTESTSSLPVMAFTVPSWLPGSGAVYSFDPWSNLMGTTSILGSATSTETGKTLREILEPWWNILWSIILAISVIATIMGLRQQHK